MCVLACVCGIIIILCTFYVTKNKYFFSCGSARSVSLPTKESKSYIYLYVRIIYNTFICDMPNVLYVYLRYCIAYQSIGVYII